MAATDVFKKLFSTEDAAVAALRGIGANQHSGYHSGDAVATLLSSRGIEARGGGSLDVEIWTTNERSNGNTIQEECVTAGIRM